MLDERPHVAVPSFIVKPPESARAGAEVHRSCPRLYSQPPASSPRRPGGLGPAVLTVCSATWDGVTLFLSLSCLVCLAIRTQQSELSGRTGHMFPEMPPQTD